MPWLPDHDLVLIACWIAGKPAIEIGQRLDRTLAEIADRRVRLNLPDRVYRVRPDLSAVGAVAS